MDYLLSSLLEYQTLKVIFSLLIFCGPSFPENFLKIPS